MLITKSLKRILLLCALIAQNLALAPDLFAEDPASTEAATQAAEGSSTPSQTAPSVAPTPPPNDDQQAPGPSAAERFQALRQKRLEEARAYQQEQEARARALEQQRQKEEEERLNKKRQEYASDKEAFLSRFMKKPTPTPTPTPSVLDQLDELVAPEEGEGAQEIEDTGETQEIDPEQEGSEAQIDLNNY